MPVNSSKYVPKKDGLAARASRSGPSHAALMTAARPANTPDSNTGCSLRHGVDNACENEVVAEVVVPDVPQSTPPPKRARKSRARKTTPELEAWLDQWFFDWLSVTVPNRLNGKGSRRGTSRAELAEAEAYQDQSLRKAAIDHCRAERDAGRFEAKDALDTLSLWAVSQDLHQVRVGRGQSGYAGGLTYGVSPVDTEPFAVVQAGHATNMPGLTLSGGEGACARLAPTALALLGPVLLARADVTWDWSREGFFDELLDYARAVSATSRMAAPRVIESDTGRTFYWGDAQSVSVKVYQKDLERVARKKLAIDDADPDLVRVEYRFAPPSASKAGMAALARDHGAGALLGTTLWVRRMVEHIAVLTGAAKKGAKMAIQRVDKTPDPRTCADRAGYGLTQYAGTMCAAVVAQIVKDQHAGDWRAAEIDADEVRAGVLDMVAAYVDATDAAALAVSRLGVDRARDIEGEAERGVIALDNWMRRQDETETQARADLLDAAMIAALRAAEPADEDEDAPAPAEAYRPKRHKSAADVPLGNIDIMLDEAERLEADNTCG